MKSPATHHRDPVRFISVVILVFCILVSSYGCARVRGGSSPDFSNAQRPATLNASAFIRFTNSDGAEKVGKAAIAVRSPDLFRVEVLGPLNQTMLLFLSDGHAAYLYTEDGSEQRYFEEIDPREIVGILLGAQRWPLEAPGPVDASGGGYIVEKDALGRVTMITMVREGGEGAVKVGMDDYKTLQGVALPFAFTIETASERLSIRYRRVKLGREIEGALFSRP